MKRASVLFLIFLFFMSSHVNMKVKASETAPETPSVWSLKDLFKRALAYSEQIQIAEQQLFITEKDRDKAFALLVPRFTAFGEYRWNDQLTTQKPESSLGLGLRLDQSVTLNGKEFVAFGLTKDRIIQSQYDLETVKEAYLFQVASAYYDVLKSIQTKEIAISSVKRLDVQKKAVVTKLALEEIPKTELFRTDAELSGSRTALVVAENGLYSSRILLARLVDLPEHFKIGAPGKTREPSADLDLATIQKTALSNRADLQSKQMAQKISEGLIKVSRGDYWPTLSLDGMYLRSDADPTAFLPQATEPPYETVRDGFTVGLSLNFPIYDGGVRRAGLSQARAQARQAELQVKDYEKLVSLEAKKAYLDMVTAKSAIGSLGDQLKSANENYTAITHSFDNGLADSLDVIDANTLLQRSESELLEARYRYAQAILNLHWASGRFMQSVEEYFLEE